MTTQTKTRQPSATTTNQKSALQHHRIRTIFASLFGILAMFLILTSFLIVWLNRTVTDTPTFVSTVAPLATKQAVQTFVADKVTTQLLDSAPTQDLASTLLPSGQVAGKTTEQLRTLVQPVVNNAVLSVIQSARFNSLWSSTITSAHTQLISQLNANSSSLTLDLSPAVIGVVALLKQSSLAPIAPNINIEPGAGVINLKGGPIDKAHQYYASFNQATLAIVILTLISIALCVWISVHHLKTARRILLGTSIIALVTAVLLEVPSLITPTGSDATTQAAAFTIIQTLFHNLQVALLIIGVSCLVLVIASKVYSKLHHKRI